MKLARKALAVACMVAVAGPVIANSSSTITIGNVNLTLIDLNPDDGIAASIYFVPDTQKYSAGANIGGVAQTGQAFGSEPGNQYDSFFKTGAWASSNVSGQAKNDLATSSASVTGSASGVGYTAASLSGSALSSSSQGGYFFSEAKMQANPLREKEFILSANTQVVFSIDTALSSSTTIGHAPGASNGEYAWAEVLLYVGGLHTDGVTWLADVQQQRVSVDYADGSAPFGGTDSWSGTMSASFSNLNSFSTQGELGTYASLRGQSVMTAVPEPSTYGMLLGGLGLLGVAARRRRHGAK